VSSDEMFYKFGQNKSHLVYESGFRHFCAEFLTGSLKSTTTKFTLNIKAEKTVLFYSIATCMSYDRLLLYSSATPRLPFISGFFVLTANQTPISFTRMPPSGCAMPYYMVNAQLFLQP